LETQTFQKKQPRFPSHGIMLMGTNDMIMAMNYTPASSPSCMYKYHGTLVISTLAPCIQDPFSPSERIWGGHGIRVLSQSDIHEWSVLDDLSVEVGATMCDLTKPLLGGKQCFLGAAMS
jgi:hypothetical protein